MTDTYARRGRPPGTTRRELEVIALRLFAEQGFDETTIDQIATAAGINKRSFFRYFASKGSLLWSAFDAEVEALRTELAAAPPELPIMQAVRRAVVAVNHYRAEDVPELRTRMNLIGSSPGLSAGASAHYDAWERVVAEFVGHRCGQPADSLLPLTVARATLAACRAAYDRWVARADANLTVYIDAALGALSAGFADSVLVAEPAPRGYPSAGR
ncbi:mycofactocin system transcriptional regulator [Micromonospora costi]|uniref:mycofactocin system transcriptional regulator n=1 Tax=Micromonospora costi TaxID=1530042 RepID=UPI00340E83B6